MNDVSSVSSSSSASPTFEIKKSNEFKETPDDYPGSKPQLEKSWGVNGCWDDWHWQIKNSIRSTSELKKYLSEKEISIENIIQDTKETEKIFPFSITPYYLSLIKNFDNSDPIFKMAIPNSQELVNPSFLSNDPLNEESDTAVEGLVHRYKDRALILSTSQCAMYCRYCTRKRVAGTKDYHLTDLQLDNIVNYLKTNPEIKDVIISGGDPLTLSTRKLEKILSKVRSVPSVDIIRIGTKTPVTLPMRITSELISMINRYHPVFVNTHFNHPNEITAQSKNACLKMISRGIPVNNQSVLLKGVNDDPQIMAELCRNLLKIRLRPYYLFQCDLVKGVEHFRTTIDKGIEIMSYLRGNVSGLGIPNYIVDAPEGKGKIPLLPNYLIKKEENGFFLSNYKGECVFYPNPEDNQWRIAYK